MAYIVTFILRKQLKERGQEGDELGGHLVQLVEVGVGVDIAETRPDRLVDKQQVGELVPGTVVVRQGMVVLQAIRADLHQRAIHRAAPRASIQPDDGALAIGDMTVLEMPEEKVPVVLRIYLNVPFRQSCQQRGSEDWGGARLVLPSMHLQQGPFGGTW